MTPHPTRALIEGDATNVLDFGGFVAHTLVQVAGEKQDTNTLKRSYDTPSYNTGTYRNIWALER